MDLLTGTDIAEIRAAMGDLKDTFHNTQITYKVFNGTLDRFMEDEDSSSYTTHTLMALVEYGVKEENDRFKSTDSGKVETMTIKVTLNVDYLSGLGLWDNVNNLVKFNPASDKLFVKGYEYDITQVGYEGEFEDKRLHVLIFADPRLKKT